MSFVINPGTIQSPLTAGGVAYGTGSSAKISAAGTSGQVLQSNGALPPTFVTFSGGVTSVAMTVPSVFNVSGSPITSSGTLAVTYSGTPLPIANGGTGTATPALVQGCGITITGSWPNQTITSAVPAAKTCTFNSSGTWTKPSGYGTTARVFIQAWGGGGSGNKYRCCSNSIGGSGGGGGGYNYRWISIACLTSTVTVTIGAGGAATSGTTGNGGGQTSFGTYVKSYGGGGGATCLNFSGGGGGGQTGPGNTLGASGSPVASSSFFISTKTIIYEGAGAFKCGGSYVIAQDGYFKGGGGGGGYAISTYRPGGNAVWGGGGGGGTNGCSGGNGGTSAYGGNGGAGGTCGGTAGTQPGGGGGGSWTSGTSGKGGDGRVIVTVFAGI